MNRELLKALFKSLVEAAGGSVPSGVALGISDATVRQLYRLDDDKDPSLLKHVLPLESFVGRPIVTAGLAKLAGGDDGEDLGAALEQIAADLASVTKAIRRRG